METRVKTIRHFIDDEVFKQLDKEYEAIILMLNAMEKQGEKFCFPTVSFIRHAGGP